MRRASEDFDRDLKTFVFSEGDIVDH